MQIPACYVKYQRADYFSLLRYFIIWELIRCLVLCETRKKKHGSSQKRPKFMLSVSTVVLWLHWLSVTHISSEASGAGLNLELPSSPSDSLESKHLKWGAFSDSWVSEPVYNLTNCYWMERTERRDDSPFSPAASQVLKLSPRCPRFQPPGSEWVGQTSSHGSRREGLQPDRGAEGHQSQIPTAQ